MNTTSKKMTLTEEIIILSPVDLVWHAWTVSERVSKWFAPEANIEAKIGGAYELYFVPENKSGMNTKGCKITELVINEVLQFTWKGPDPFEEVMNKNDLTVVTVQFISLANNETKVVIEHTGFKKDWAEAYKWHQMAWQGVLQSLKSALETGEGELCCQP